MEKNTLSAVSDVVVQEPVELVVDIRPRNRLHAWLQRRRILPRQQTLKITPITFGNLIRISKLLLEIDMKDFDIAALHESNYTLIRDHGPRVASIVALAVHNKRSQPPEWLVSFILNNFTSKELLATLLIILKQMNITDFFNSIISIRGMNVLERKIASAKSAESDEVSPMNQGS